MPPCHARPPPPATPLVHTLLSVGSILTRAHASRRARALPGSTAQYWVLWFISELSLDFNPFPCVTRFFRRVNLAIACCSCRMINTRIGRWHIERAFVHGLIRQRVRERGISNFFLPEAIDPKDLVKAEDIVTDNDDLLRELGW